MEPEVGEQRDRPALMIGAGVSALVLLAGAVTALYSCGRVEPPAEQTATPTFVAATPAPTLPQLVLDAENCLKLCSGKGVSENSKLALPYKFASLIEKKQFASAFQKLIAGFPPSYAGLARLSADDYEGLDFNGSADAVLTTAEGRTIQIYYNVGYAERHGDNADTAQRPSGFLHVAVDLATGEMAGIFNGPDTLSDYRFVGRQDLYAPLLAYIVADENHLAKLQQMGFPENGPKIAFPLAAADISLVSDRLRYLAGHFADGKITGAQSVDDIKEASDDAAGRNWYTVNSERTLCFKVGGPAEKLRDFVGNLDRPTTNDFRDADGNLTKVEVVNTDENGTDHVWTYYRHRAECESDWVTRNEDLANQYE